MKKIIFLMPLVCACFGVITQKHNNSPSLDKFVGTWVYNKDGKTVEINLKKVVTTIKDIKIDEIEGYYNYKINGKVVENTQKRQRPSLRHGSNHAFNSYSTDTNQIALSLFDSVKRKGGDLILIFKPGTPDELQWSLINREAIIAVPVGGPKFDKTFTLPENMTLTKKDD